MIGNIPGRHIVLFLAAGVVALGAGYWLGEHRERTSAPAGADTLVEFSLPDIEGRMRSTGEWRDKALLINFWATWCTPCRDEIPEFIEAQEEFGGQGLQILGVALDRAEPVSAFMQEMGFNYPSLIAQTEGMEIMARYGNTGALPFTVAFDRDGRVVGKKLGRVSRAQIRAFVESML